MIFLGDSIIQYLQFMEMWHTCFAPMHALNFGIGGDTVQNVLWRVQNGELENVSPKVNQSPSLFSFRIDGFNLRSFLNFNLIFFLFR